jgi:hypothetical protein
MSVVQPIPTLVPSDAAFPFADTTQSQSAASITDASGPTNLLPESTSSPSSIQGSSSSVDLIPPTSALLAMPEFGVRTSTSTLFAPSMVAVLISKGTVRCVVRVPTHTEGDAGI